MSTVTQDATTGRWFITMGTPGFNLPANNGRGYATKSTALAAVRRCSAARPRFIFDRDMMGNQILRRVDGAR